MHKANDDRDKTIWTITTDLTSKVAETRKKRPIKQYTQIN